MPLIPLDKYPTLRQTTYSAAEAELAKRSIGASDANLLANGKFREVYDRKTGSDVGHLRDNDLAPMLGIYLEPFHRDYFAYHTQMPVVGPGLRVTAAADKEHPPLHATLDGKVRLANDMLVPWEGKTGGDFRAPEELARAYYPQFQHQMYVTGSEQLCFSWILLGRGTWDYAIIDFDIEYWRHLEQLYRSFWTWIENGPPASEHGAGPDSVAKTFAGGPAAPGMKLPWKTVNMETTNEWPIAAASWLEAKPYVEQADNAEAILKGAVPKDATKAFGCGVYISKNKKGSLSLRAIENEAKLAELVKLAQLP